MGSRGKFESENSLAEIAKNGVLEVKRAIGTGEARLEKPLFCFVKLMNFRMELRMDDDQP